jgi:RHS repeat-associated protein
MRFAFEFPLQIVLDGNKEYWGNTYNYAPWGNLLQEASLANTCEGEGLSVNVGPNNRISTAGYAYDAAGNMTNDALGQSYTYDQENRITGAAGFNYTYDADGNRVEKANGSNGTLYWYMTPGIVAESDLTGTLKSEYVFFAGERVARCDLAAPTGVVYYFSDHLKTASVITDAAGKILNESDYYPWGGELQYVNADSNHYKFTGKERDAETQLDYFGARYYSNGLGRFISPDWSVVPVPVPYADLTDPETLCQYCYVRGLPTTRADLDGHGWWGDFGGGLYDSTVGPIVQTVAHPINTAVALGHAAAHPINTAVAVGNATVATVKAAASGDGKAIGQVVGTAISAVATAGTGKLATSLVKGAEVAEVAETAATVSRAESAAGTASKVDQVVNTIDEGGFNVTQNAKTATQEGNITITHPNEPGIKLNVRVETHPTPGSNGQPVRHANVQRVESGAKNRPVVKSNTHITD